MLVKRMDSLMAREEIPSRSEFLAQATDFYCGYLETQSCSSYLEKTVLKVMEQGLLRLESRMCKQLYRLCIESAINSHLTVSMVGEIPDEDFERLRVLCEKAVRKNVGTIRFDRIYVFQKGQISVEDYLNEHED